MLKYNRKNIEKKEVFFENENFQFLEIDDTLKTLLLKNIYEMNFNDEILRAILGEENTSFKPGDLLGIMGTTGSGKSMLIQYIIALLILPEELKGHNLKVLYIDTDINFSIEMFVEKYLIPIIEKKIQEINNKDNFEKKFENDEFYINKIISISLNNLNIIQVSDLLDLICIIRQIEYSNYDSRVIVIDSINFWNADLSSYLINKENLMQFKDSDDLKNYIFGYYSNKNTLFNCLYSLITYIVKYNGFIAIITINEDFILNFDKYKNCFTEELIELPNFFNKNNFNSDISEEKTIMIKFQNIKNLKLIKNYIDKLFNNHLNFTNIIWISKSSFPINEEIHHYPNCSIIPSYFICVNDINKQSFLLFNDYNGLILLS